MTFKIKDKKSKFSKINSFVAEFGNGKDKLTREQRDKRREKILGSDANKFIGLGNNKMNGVKRIKKKDIQEKIQGDSNTVDCFDDDFYDNIENYPDDNNVKGSKAKIFNVSVDEYGAGYIDGVILDGNEKDLKARVMYSLMIQNDEDKAMLEKKLFNDGKLKKVSDRTMNIHEAEGILDAMLDAEDVDTEDDLECEY